MQMEFNSASTKAKLEQDFSLRFQEVTDENVTSTKRIGIEGDLLTVDIYGLVTNKVLSPKTKRKWLKLL